MRKIRLELLVLLLIAISLVGSSCSSSNNYKIVSEGDYKVAVSSPLMSHGTDTLVHRLTVKETELFQLCATESRTDGVGCLSGLGLHLDSSEQPDGVVVESCQGVCRLFSWMKGDIVISLNGNKINRVLDVELITDVLLRDNKVVIEVIRSGLPHKFYYSLLS